MSPQAEEAVLETTEPTAPIAAPRTLDDLDRIVDLYYLEPVTGAPVETARTGGQGAYVYYGPPQRADLRGTELADGVDDRADVVDTGGAQ